MTDTPTGRRTFHGIAELEKAWGTHEAQGVRMSVNYGAKQIRFPAPVPVGSRVRAGVEFLDVTPGGGGYPGVTRITVERAGGDRPVCVADTVTVVVP